MLTPIIDQPQPSKAGGRKFNVNMPAGAASRLESVIIQRLYPGGAKDGRSPLDQALATSNLALARTLVAQRRRDISEEDFWLAAVSNKHLPENQDLLRALLILDRKAAARLAQIYRDDLSDAINTVSVLHHGMKSLSKELQDSLREIPYYSPKRPGAIDTNGKDDWWCRHLATLWGHQRTLSSGRAFNHDDIADPERRKEKFDLAAEARRYEAIRVHSRECYPVLIEPDLDNPDQKTFGDFLVAHFDTMQPGQSRLFSVGSGSHAMFLELKKKREDGEDLFVANSFDPNRTNVHKHAQTNRLEVVRKEWRFSAFLYNDNFRQKYWPPGTRHAMVAEVTSWSELDSPGPIEKNRAAHLDYTNEPASSEVLTCLSEFSLDDTLREQLNSLDTEKKMSWLSQPNSKGATPLFVACQNGRTGIVQIIQSAVSPEQFFELLKIKGPEEETPFFTACRNGHTGIVKIIQSVVSPEQFDALLKMSANKGTTPLRQACKQGHTELVKIIQSAVPPDQFAELLKIKGPQEGTPFIMACQSGHTGIVQIIQSAVSPEQFAELLKINGAREVTPLFMACQNGHTEIVKIIQSAVSPEQFADLLKMSANNGATPLRQARRKGHTEIVKIIQSALSSDRIRQSAE